MAFPNLKQPMFKAFLNIINKQLIMCNLFHIKQLLIMCNRFPNKETPCNTCIKMDKKLMCIANTTALLEPNSSQFLMKRNKFTKR